MDCIITAGRWSAKCASNSNALQNSVKRQEIGLRQEIDRYAVTNDDS